MSHRVIPFILLFAGLAGTASSDDDGFVLKRGEGERYFDGEAIVKASPRTGSQSAEMIWQSLPPGTSTGRHVHHQADEFFYVIAGQGTALVNGKEIPITAGDIMFVPRGGEHRLRPVDKTSVLEIIFLVDRPGLAEEMREGDSRARKLGRNLTLEELNEIAERHGTTYYSLD